MLPYNAKDLATAFRTVRSNTIRTADEIPEDKYAFAPAPGTRTVAQLLTHIALLTGFQEMVQGEKRTTLEGVDFPGLMVRAAAEEQKPRSKSEVVGLLRTRGDAFAEFLESCGDEFLAERVALPAGAQPPSKTRFEMLMSAKEHEMHHRGQLMLIQRMLGLTPHLTREREARFAARS